MTEGASANRLLDIAARLGARDKFEEAAINHVREALNALRHGLVHRQDDGFAERVSHVIARTGCMRFALNVATQLFQGREDWELVKAVDTWFAAYKRASERLERILAEYLQGISEWQVLTRDCEGRAKFRHRVNAVVAHRGRERARKCSTCWHWHLVPPEKSKDGSTWPTVEAPADDAATVAVAEHRSAQCHEAGKVESKRGRDKVDRVDAMLERLFLGSEAARKAAAVETLASDPEPPHETVRVTAAASAACAAAELLAAGDGRDSFGRGAEGYKQAIEALLEASKRLAKGLVDNPC